MLSRLSALALGLAAAAGAAPAQPLPARCEILRECQGETCADEPDGAVGMEMTALGPVIWDEAHPNFRLRLLEIPGPGPRAFAGRAEDDSLAVLVSLTRQGGLAISLHGSDPEAPITTLRGRCDMPPDAGQGD